MLLRKCHIRGPLRIHSFVQGHTYCVLLIHRSVEDTLHDATCTHGLLDAPASAMFGPQIEWTEPTNVVRVEEHESHGGLLLVHTIRGSRKNGLFYDDAIGIARLDGPDGGQFWHTRAVLRHFEGKDWKG